MPKRLLLLALSFFVVALAGAQEAPASRLDQVQKNGKLQVCTPGDYKPFSLQRWLHLAKATGDYERAVGRWLR
jgi:cyclohexadienyl dehydratase